jgi:hypothetical protein
MFFLESYGLNIATTCLRRDFVTKHRQLQAVRMATTTVNNHLVSLSTFTTGVHVQIRYLFQAGDPVKGIGEIGLPLLEPHTLNADHIHSLKSVCDQYECFHPLKWRNAAHELMHCQCEAPCDDLYIAHPLSYVHSCHALVQKNYWQRGQI